jgi:hypothetical protein
MFSSIIVTQNPQTDFRKFCTPHPSFLSAPPPSSSLPNTTNLGIRWPFHFPALLFPPLSWNSRRLYSVYMEGVERAREGGQKAQSSRVLCFFSSRWNWDFPNPSPARECANPLVPGGGARSLAREGVGESQFRRGDIHCGTLYICICTLWVGRKGLSLGFQDAALHTHTRVCSCKLCTIIIYRTLCRKRFCAGIFLISLISLDNECTKM